MSTPPIAILVTKDAAALLYQQHEYADDQRHALEEEEKREPSETILLSENYHRTRLMHDLLPRNEDYKQPTTSLLSHSPSPSFSSSEFTIPTSNKSNATKSKKIKTYGDHTLDLTRTLQDSWSLRDQDDPPTRPSLTRAPPSHKKRDKLGDWTFRHGGYSASHKSLSVTKPSTAAPNYTRSLPAAPSPVGNSYPPGNTYFHRQRSVKIFDQRDLQPLCS